MVLSASAASAHQTDEGQVFRHWRSDPDVPRPVPEIEAYRGEGLGGGEIERPVEKGAALVRIPSPEDGLEAGEAGPGDGGGIVNEDVVVGGAGEEDLVPMGGVGTGGKGNEGGG